MKTIPAVLLSHLAQTVTTRCFLAKVECQGQYAGQKYGFTNLDIDVTYDDGDGPLLYNSDNGYTPLENTQTSGPDIDETELAGILSDTGITEQQVRAGLFRSAKVTIYRINYNDLTSGRHEVIAYGHAGKTKFERGSWKTEFWPLSELLNQLLGEVYSLTCNAKFGDARCKKAITWAASGTVTSVGTETDRIFSDTSRTEPDGYFSDHNGIVEWLTGDNAGIEMEIDLYQADSAEGTFELLMALPYPIQVGDTYRPRRDCDQLFETCRDVHNNVTNNRGHHTMPVDGTAMVPGAEIDR